MKLFIALALVAVAAAGRHNRCPPNSKLLSSPYRDMRNCQCTSGYKAYPYPGWGCYKKSNAYKCPSNAAPLVNPPRSFKDCQCKAGYAMSRTGRHASGSAMTKGTDMAKKQDKRDAHFVKYQGKCAFAYIFHVHGRVWLAPYSKGAFTQAKETTLRKVMANRIGAKGVTWHDVLPYSIHYAQRISTDLKDARLDHAKIILGVDESGAKAAAGSAGVSIGFAVHEVGASMRLANHLVEKMKTKLLPINAVRAAFPRVKYCKIYLWALTGAFWKRPTKNSYTWAPSVAPTAYPTKKPTPKSAATKAPVPQPFCKAEISITFHLRCDCGSLKWGTPVSKCMKRGFMTMHRFTSQKRAAFIVGFSKYLQVPSSTVSLKRVSPINRANDHAKGNGVAANTWYNPVSYSPGHAKWTGIAVTVGIKAFTMKEANRVLAAAQSSALPKSVAWKVSRNGFQVHPRCIQVQKDTIHPHPCPGAKLGRLPTPTPTPAPTPEPLRPGSQPSCDLGTVMQIKGVARLQSSTLLADPDMYMRKVRGCMAKTALRTMKWCMMNTRRWTVTKFVIRHKHSPIKERGLHTYKNLKPHHFKCGGKDCKNKKGQLASKIGSRRLAAGCEGCVIYTYTFVFHFNVPGQDMHVGNKIFDYMHARTKKFLSTANKCLSGSYFVPPMASRGNTFRPITPVLESMNVSSIRYTYIAPAVTVSPTPKSTEVNKHCKLSIWSGYTVCSKSCGGGVQSKFRVVLSAHSGNGKCPNTKFVRKCNTGSCAVDCTVGRWGKYNTCTKSCGGGHQYSKRRILTGSRSGKKCPALVRSRRCNLVPCPIDCKVSTFSKWSGCTKRCGGGEMKRFRTITQTAYYFGKPCPPLVQKAKCNSNPCAKPCKVSKWSAWGSCSKSCAGQPAGKRLFGAKQERTRFVVQQAAWGGHPCPALTQTKLCALHPCGAKVCTTRKGFPLTCTYEKGIVYTHHVNDVHDHELFMCYHNYVTEVCTCLCWPKHVKSVHRRWYGASDVSAFVKAHNKPTKGSVWRPKHGYHY